MDKKLVELQRYLLKHPNAAKLKNFPSVVDKILGYVELKTEKAILNARLGTHLVAVGHNSNQLIEANKKILKLRTQIEIIKNIIEL